MKKSLYQKRGFSYRKFTLTDENVIVERSNIRKIERFEIKLETLGFNIQYQADNTLPGKIFLVICIVLPIVATLVQVVQSNIDERSLIISYSLCALLIVMNLAKEHQDDIFLTGGEQNLVFYRNKPSEEAVLEFISEINDATKKCYIKKHLPFDGSMMEDEYLARISWLKNMGIITAQEFEEYKNDSDIRRIL